MDGSYFAIARIAYDCLQLHGFVGVSVPRWKYNLFPNKTANFLRTWAFNSIYHSPYQLQGLLSAFNHSAWSLGTVAAYNACFWCYAEPSIALVGGAWTWNYVPNIGRSQVGVDNVCVKNIVAKTEGYKGFTPRLCAIGNSNRFDLHAYSPRKLLHCSIAWFGLLDYDVCGSRKP